MHSLDTTEFDVTRGRWPTDPRLGTRGVEVFDDVRNVGDDLILADDHDVVVGNQRDDSSPLIRLAVEYDRAGLGDARGATRDDGVGLVDDR